MFDVFLTEDLGDCFDGLHIEGVDVIQKVPITQFIFVPIYRE
jgi:hypothetical protein